MVTILMMVTIGGAGLAGGDLPLGQNPGHH